MKLNGARDHKGTVSVLHKWSHIWCDMVWSTATRAIYSSNYTFYVLQWEQDKNRISWCLRHWWNITVDSDHVFYTLRPEYCVFYYCIMPNYLSTYLGSSSYDWMKKATTSYKIYHMCKFITRVLRDLVQPSHKINQPVRDPLICVIITMQLQ